MIPKFNNQSIGTHIPAATLIGECYLAKDGNCTHTIITQNEAGVDTLMSIKLPEGKKFFKYVKKYVKKGTEFRFLDLRDDFEKVIRNFHPGAKALASES